MSGHSKWHKIRHTKAASDKKKSKEFGRVTRDIQTAAQEGGTDPDKNAALRDAIGRAKKSNMPQTNIDRLLSSRDESNLEEITYEAFGPGGTGIIIKVKTDNPNRIVAEVRTALKNNNGSLGGPNSVQWKFNNELKPNYPLKISSNDNQALQQLITQLQDSADVSEIYTDVLVASSASQE